jgi:hypothetical protein
MQLLPSLNKVSSRPICRPSLRTVTSYSRSSRCSSARARRVQQPPTGSPSPRPASRGSLRLRLLGPAGPVRPLQRRRRRRRRAVAARRRRPRHRDVAAASDESAGDGVMAAPTRPVTLACLAGLSSGGGGGGIGADSAAWAASAALARRQHPIIRMWEAKGLGLASLLFAAAACLRRRRPVAALWSLDRGRSAFGKHSPLAVRQAFAARGAGQARAAGGRCMGLARVGTRF